MKTLIYLALAGIICVICLGSCRNNKSNEYQEAVEGWMGKEVLFTDSLQKLSDSLLTSVNTDYLIVSYYDSVGCTQCRMKLSNWREFLDKTDSVTGGNRVALLLIADTRDVKELTYLLKETDLTQNLYHDKDGIMNRLNSFPHQKELQTFLLDRNHKVLIVGSPLMSAKMEKLYLDRIVADSGVSAGDVEEYEEYEYDFGTIGINETVSHRFELVNNSADTLRVRKVIPSCECTRGEVSSMAIAPSASYNVTTTFRDTVEGDFLRSVTLYFENHPEIRFELTGNIK